MSDQSTGGYSTPLKTMFEMQRSWMAAGREMLDQSKSVQRTATKGMLTGLRAQELSQRQAVELSRTATHSYMNVVKAMMPGGERDIASIQRSLDAQFDDLEEVQSVAYQNMEASLREFDDLSEEYIETLQAQTTATEDAAHRIEVETVRSADEVGRVAERSMSETVEATEATSQAMAEVTDATGRAAQSTLDTAADVAESTQDVAETATVATEDVTETAMEAGEDVAESTAAATEEAAERTGRAGAESMAHSIELFDTVEEEYVDALQEAGFETVSDLADANADHLSDVADVSENQAGQWISDAQERRIEGLEIVDGIGEERAEQLAESGFGTLDDVANASAGEISDAVGVSANVAEKWISDAEERRSAGLTVVDGIGEGRAKGLADAGIETLADLAKADADEIADVVGVSTDRAEGWIDEARP